MPICVSYRRLAEIDEMLKRKVGKAPINEDERREIFAIIAELRQCRKKLSETHKIITRNC